MEVSAESKLATNLSHIRKAIALVCLLSTVTVCADEFNNTYTITGQYLVSRGIEFDHHRTRLTDKQRTTTANVVVTFERVNDEGQTETVELASGSFVNNKIRFEGEIDQPTEVEISVHDDENDISTTSALIVPGDNEVAFAYVRSVNIGDDSTNVWLLGNSRLSKDPTKKFSITGDLRSLDKQPALARAKLMWKEHVNGEFKTHVIATVLTKDKTFSLEADVDEAIVAEVFVSFFYDNLFFFSFLDVVLEPHAEIKIKANKLGDDLVAIAEHGRHNQLIDSWSQSEEYLKKTVTQAKSLARYVEALGPIHTRLTTSSESFPTIIKRNPSESSGETNNTKSDPTKATGARNHGSDMSQTLQKDELSDSPLTTDGCEQVALDSVQSTIDEGITETEEKEHILLQRELDEIRAMALQDIAKSTKDPMNALLALELGAFSPNSKNRDDAFPIFDNLFSVLDSDLVARRVSPKRAILHRDIEKWDNNADLIPGTKVPPLTLASVQGIEYSLEEVLQENQFVLIDYWASWCYSCTSEFRRLKLLHTLYKDEGFEIVSVSIDSTVEAWKDSSEEHQLPWIDLGEIEGWNGSISKAYGVSTT